jgi:hypothetical protein
MKSVIIRLLLCGCSFQCAISPLHATEADSLEVRVRKCYPDAIKQVAREDRRDMIPALKEAAEAPLSYTAPGRVIARKLLAKWGVREYYDEFMLRLLVPTNSLAFREQEAYGDPPACQATKIRGQAFQDLIHIDQPASVKHIAPFLWDFGEVPCESFSLPAAYAAVYALSQMTLVDSLSPEKNAQLGTTKQIQAWQQWWEKHREYYEKVEFGQPLLPWPPGDASAAGSVDSAPPLNVRTSSTDKIPAQATGEEEPVALPAMRSWLWVLLTGLVVLAVVVWLSRRSSR